MNGAVEMTTAPDLSLPSANIPPPAISSCGDWTLHEHRAVSSTNLLAANLSAWTAIRADTQSAGRGRFQRTWISDRGGLWLSAVVPLGQGALERRTLPLAAGLAVCNALHELGLRARLRWPNDVMVNDRKLAGLLIDQFVPGLAVIGVGLNVTNHPETLDPTLKNNTTRLADLMAQTPGIPALAALTLRHVRTVLRDISGTPGFLMHVNDLWGPPRPVQLDLDGIIRQGLLTGVDAEARLRLVDDAGRISSYDPAQVRHLTEI